MTTPTPEVLGAIVRLEGDRDFKAFMDWIEDSRKGAIDRVVTCPETDLEGARSELRTITDLKKTILTARDELKTMAEISANTASADRQ